MFVKTVKLKKPNPVAVVIILAAVLILVAVWVLGSSGKGVGDKYKLPTNQERKTFLSDLGWNVSDKETDCKIIKIPSKFNAVYNVYNKMQKQQGFDLTDFKGETVELYTYEVYNYPDNPKNIVAHLIICKGTLIGGDVCSTESDGFIHGLMPVDKKGMKNSGTQDARTTQSPTGTTTAPATTKAPAENDNNEAKATTPAATTAATDETTKVPSTTTKAPDNANSPNNNEANFFFTQKNK